MSPDRSLSNLFNAALELHDASERARFLEEACGGDLALRERVEKLLLAQEEIGGFMAQPSRPAFDLDSDPKAAAGIPLTEKPGDLIGRYKLLQQIGEGGCGVVYMAEQGEPVRRRVALKVIKLGMDTRQVIARFEAERQALALMDHPNIARVLDAGATDTGRPFFVMELVRGVKITEFCDENKLPTEDRLKLFMQVCRAIQHAHQKGVIHRDIKPSNIIVTINDGVPVPKVIDFGIAKATVGRLTDQTLFTAFEQFIGTPAYMSPEQAVLTSLDIDTRSDIYSLGVLLYELLTGSPPFDQKELLAAGLDEMRRTIREKEPPRPSTRLSTMAAAALTTTAHHRHTEPPRLLHSVRGDLDWIAMKCLEKDRARRYETANALAMDIERHLNCEPVTARPPSRLYEFQKTVRRHKFGFAAAALVFAALTLGFAAAMWGLFKARDSQAIAEGAQRALKTTNEQLASQLKRAEAAEGLANNQAEQLGRQLYDIKLPRAAAAFREGQFSVARENLRDCPAGQRGWEWRWLSQQVEAKLPALTIPGRQLPQFMPDSRQLLVVDPASQREVKFWNTATGTVERTIGASDARITQMKLSADGKKLAIGMEDGGVALWDVSDGRQLWSVKAHTRLCDGLDFDMNGVRLASVSWDGTLKIFSTRDGKEQVSGRIENQSPYVQELRGVSFHPDGSQVVTAKRQRLSDSPSGRVWDARTGKVKLELMGSRPRCVTYSPDGQWIATGNEEGIVRIFAAETGKEVRSVPGHDGFIAAIAYSPDGTRLATSGQDTTVRLCDSQSGHSLAIFRGHSLTVNCLAFSPDGRYLASSDPRGVVNIWDTTIAPEDHTSVHLRSLAAASNSPVSSVAFSPDGTDLVTVTELGEVKLLDRDSLIEKRILASSGCSDVAISPNEQIAAAALGSVVVWNSRTGDMIRRLGGHQGAVSSVTYSLDGSRLASSGGSDATVRLWDTRTWRPLHVLGGFDTNQGILRIAFRPDGKQIASVANDGLKIWDAERGSLLHSLNVGGYLRCVTYSADGYRIAAGGKDGLLRVWDARTGNQLSSFSGGHTNEISGVAFFPDGARVVSADVAGTITIWNTQTGIPLLALTGAAATRIRDIAVSPSGDALAAGMRDGTVRLWEIGTPPALAVTRQQAQRASRIADEQLREHLCSSNALAAIRSDPMEPGEVKRLALGLAEQRLAAVNEIMRQNLQELRVLAEAPDANEQALNNCAVTLSGIFALQGNQPAHMALYREALEIYRKSLGNENRLTRNLLMSVGLALQAQGRPGEAATFLREELKLARAPDGKGWAITNSELGMVLHHFAETLCDQKAFKEAHSPAKEAWALYREHRDWPENERTHAFHVLDEVLSNLNDQPALDSLHRDELARLRARLAPEDRDLAGALAIFASSLLAQQKFAEAEAPARECLAIREKVMPDSWLSFNSRSMLGGSLLGQNKYAEAEPFLLSGYEGMKQREKSIPATAKMRIPEATQRLVQLYEATARPEKAAEWNQKLVESNRVAAEK